MCEATMHVDLAVARRLMKQDAKNKTDTLMAYLRDLMSQDACAEMKKALKNTEKIGG